MNDPAFAPGLLIGYLILCVLFGGLGAYVAAQKRRRAAEGLVLGALFGPIGCLIEACLPVGGAPTRRPAAAVSGSGADAKRQAWQGRRGTAAWLAGKFREELGLDDMDAWLLATPDERRAFLMPVGARVAGELGMRGAEFEPLFELALREIEAEVASGKAEAGGDWADDYGSGNAGAWGRG